jgi:hypothetical protein
MDQFTPRIVGFAVHCGVVDGVGLASLQMEPTRPPSRAIMALRRAAHLQRKAAEYFKSERFDVA